MQQPQKSPWSIGLVSSLYCVPTTISINQSPKVCFEPIETLLKARTTSYHLHQVDHQPFLFTIWRPLSLFLALFFLYPLVSIRNGASAVPNSLELFVTMYVWVFSLTWVDCERMAPGTNCEIDDCTRLVHGVPPRLLETNLLHYAF